MAGTWVALDRVKEDSLIGNHKSLRASSFRLLEAFQRYFTVFKERVSSGGLSHVRSASCMRQGT
jgi:hypothetical protein